MSMVTSEMLANAKMYERAKIHRQETGWCVCKNHEGLNMEGPAGHVKDPGMCHIGGHVPTLCNQYVVSLCFKLE